MNFPAPFGRFQLLSRIAAGGMAEVFLARSFGIEGFEKRLVIKRILPALATTPRYVELFVQEAKLCAALSHPNIVQVYELGKVGDEHFIAMEHIHGRDLVRIQRSLKARGERMPIPLAVALSAFVARALAYTHSRTTADGRSLTVLHRDISPHNVLISFEGEVKLVDFGIAQTIEEGQDGLGGGGKQAYLSPEQVAGLPTSPASDVWSLGMVLFELLSGKRLFAESDASPPPDRSFVPDIRSFNPEVPALLADILADTLIANPGLRPTAEQLESRLRRFLFETGFHSATPALAALVRRLFADELAVDPTRSDLARLAQDLDDMHTGLEPEPEATASLQSETASRSPRIPQSNPGERRSVAVLVVEINGLTEVSAQYDSEHIARTHYRILRAFRRLIDKMTGLATRYEDGLLLVLFGLPRAHGDDLDRALACARELHALALRLRKRKIVIDLSIGVHCGEVALGRRSGAHWRFAPRGDTIKAALRLAYLAEPGSTLVSDRVVGVVGDRYPFDRGPELRRKGTRSTRPSFLLTGGQRPGLRGATGRWYRRGDELETLRDAISALAQGTGARILIQGNAGIGKSHLFREIRELALRRGIPVFFGRALPFGSDRPFSPFRDLVSDILGIRGDLPLSALHERLQRLSELGLEPAEVATISTLYGVELSGKQPQQVAREAMFAAAARLVKGLSKDAPVILLMEDVQYLDGTERALFEQMLKAAEGEPVLMLMSTRTPVEFGRVHTKELGLLAPDQVVAMAAEILGAEGIGPDLTLLLQRTAEGNPLYVAEILKALHRSERIWYEGRTARLKDPSVDPNLPDTLHGLIDARIDTLAPQDKATLQLAAVIGSSFSIALLAASVNSDAPERLVDALLRAGLIQSDPTDDRLCVFSSVLIWECVSYAISPNHRRECHRSVAEGLERLYGTELNSVIEGWATHCHAGGRMKDAARGLGIAADQLRNSQFLDRALERYQKALLWVEGLPGDQRDNTMEAHLNLGAGEVAVLLGHPRAERYLQVALDIAGEEGPEIYEARALLALGRLYQSRGQRDSAQGWLDAALPLFRKHKDADGQVQVLECLGNLALERGQMGVAQGHYEAGLKVAADQQALAARMLLGLSTHALQRDDIDTAQSLLTRALPLAEGDRILTGRIHNNLGLVYFQTQNFVAALGEFQQSLAVRRGLGYRWGEIINHHNIGDAYLQSGDLPSAYAAFEQSRDLARECAWERGVVMNEIYLWFLRGLRGESVMGSLERSASAARRLGDRETAIVAMWFIARLKGSPTLIQATHQEALQAGFTPLARQIARGFGAQPV